MMKTNIVIVNKVTLVMRKTYSIDISRMTLFLRLKNLLSHGELALLKVKCPK